MPAKPHSGRTPAVGPQFALPTLAGSRTMTDARVTCLRIAVHICFFMKTTVLALTLNEIDGVRAILPQIDPSWYSQLIVVDGGSTDGTVEWCREQGYEVY